MPCTAQLRVLVHGLVPQQAAYVIAPVLADLAALLGPTADTSFGYRQADAA